MGGEDNDLSVIFQIFGDNCKEDWEIYGGFMLWVILILYTFFVIAQVCDGHLTGILEKIVNKLGLSEDVAGATFLAMSSSAPELFHSIIATFVLVSPSGVGNIVGSALFNLLCIIGVLPLCSKTGPLKIWWYPTARDSIYYAISIIEMFWVIADGKVVWYEALVMVLTYLSYVVYFIFNARIIKYFNLVVPGAEKEEEPASSEEKQQKDAVGAGDPAQPTTSPEGASAPEEFTFWVDRASGTPLGIKIDTKPDAKSCLVKELSSNKSDLIIAWNMTNHWHKSIAQGDRIVAVNGKRGDSQQILEEVRKCQGLEITVVHGRAKKGASPEANVAVTVAPAGDIASHNAKGRSSQSSECSNTRPKCPSAEAMLMVCQSNSGSLRNILSGASGSGSLKGVLEDGKENEDAGESEGRGFERRTCPTDPSLWIIDKLMPPYEYIIPAFAIVVFWVAFFTYIMVDGATRFGCIINMPHVVMGLVILAAGTSVPDMIASIAVAREGYADMAAANAVGSNTFDILLGLGGPWLISAALGKDVIIPTAQINESLIILACCLMTYVIVLSLNRFWLDRRIGFLLLFLYAAAITFTLIRHYTHYAHEED